MSNWAATNQLRFVDVKEYNTFHPDDGYEIVRTLQQKWENIVQMPNGDFEIVSEWRDVPVVEEE